MKMLNGTELAEFIKERHAKQVRSLKSRGVKPKLAIVQAKNDPVINTYVRLKQQYGADIGIDVEVHRVTQEQIPELLNMLSNDNGIYGIIIQLPLPNRDETDELVNMVSPEKDVDALGKNSRFDPATPMAILWLLSGYNIDLQGKKILLIGRGKLVGAPLEIMLKNSGLNVEVVERETDNLKGKTSDADIIITATGQPAVLRREMLKRGAVVVDAGVASEDGKTVGDLDQGVYDRDDLILTPQKGGVGPLTVCALFENVIRSATATLNHDQKN